MPFMLASEMLVARQRATARPVSAVPRGMRKPRVRDRAAYQECYVSSMSVLVTDG